MKKFSLTIFLLSVIVFSIHYILITFGFTFWSPYFLILYIYFPAITLINYNLLFKKIDQRPQSFVTTFMGVMTVKLLLSLALLLIVLYPNPELKIPFSLLFLVFYFLFSAISSADLFKKLRSKS
jgi:hypothetical protein